MNYKNYGSCGNNGKILGINSKNSKEIESFEINKAGFGMMSAWLTVENIDKIKI